MRIRFLASVCVTLLSLLDTRGASASGRAVALGEVTSLVVRREVDLEAELRAALGLELQAIDLGSAYANRWILSASLLRMDTASQERAVAQPRHDVRSGLTCVVSATVRGARGGAMVAILEGRVRVEGDDPLTPATERRAVRAAAHAALARLNEALH